MRRAVSVQQQRAGVGRQLLAQRPGARLASPISVSAETSHNERILIELAKTNLHELDIE
jgi:hypothetical protein